MITFIVITSAFLLGSIAGMAGVLRKDSELRIIGAVWMAASVIMSILG